MGPKPMKVKRIRNSQGNLVTWEELTRAEKDVFHRQSQIDKARSAEKKHKKDGVSGRRYRGEFVPDMTEEEMDELNGRSFEGTAHWPEDEDEEIPGKIQRLSQDGSSSSTEIPRRRRRRRGQRE